MGVEQITVTRVEPPIRIETLRTDRKRTSTETDIFQSVDAARENLRKDVRRSTTLAAEIGVAAGGSGAFGFSQLALGLVSKNYAEVAYGVVFAIAGIATFPIAIKDAMRKRGLARKKLNLLETALQKNN